MLNGAKLFGEFNIINVNEMKHNKYLSIPNSYLGDVITLFRQHLSQVQDWVAYEKIHGTNASFYVDASGVRKCARRNAFLQENEDQYGQKKIAERYSREFNDIFSEVALTVDVLCDGVSACDFQNYGYIIIYGELFGGHYPHEDVEPVPGAKRIQPHVYYHPDNMFLIFDVRAVYMAPSFSESKGVDFSFFFPPVSLGRIIPESLCIPIVDLGTLDSMLKIKVDFHTLLQDKYDLPVLDSKAEGVVIRPFYEEYLLPDGSRALLKKKSSKFLEKKAQKKKNDKELPELTEDQAQVYQALGQYINQARMLSVASKLDEGVLSGGFKSFNLLMDALRKDAVKDFMEENNRMASIYCSMNGKEERVMKKLIGHLISAEVKNFLLSGIEL